MKTIKILGISLLASCGSQSVEDVNEFRRLLPDTSKTWAGQMTRNDFHLTRNLEKKFHLQTLTNGTKDTELRIWNLSGSYDPQSLNILRQSSTDKWSLRTLSYYRTKSDSVIADYTRPIRSASIDSVNLSRFWAIPSQSDLTKGDSYGCMDGGTLFIELADETKYRFLWYNCPDINKSKDSVFVFATELVKRLNVIAAE